MLHEITPKVLKRILDICNQLEVGFSVRESDIETGQFESGAVSTIVRVTFRRPPPTTRLPSSIVIKFYPTDRSESQIGYQIRTSQLNNVEIGQCHWSLSPPVLLVQNDAIVWEYFPSRVSTHRDELNPSFRRQIACMFARLHSLQVPIQRNDHREQLLYVFDHWFSDALVDSVYSGTVNQILLKHKLQNMLRSDLRREANFIRDLILDQQKMPVVFSHRDCHRDNILVGRGDIILNPEKEPKIRLIDFDFACYFYRGCDLGRYIANCGHEELYNDSDLMSDEEMVDLAEAYRCECSRIYGTEFGDDPTNTVVHILKEAKLFALFGYWIDIIFAISVATNSEDEMKRVQFALNAERRFRGYLQTKCRFQQDGTVPFGPF